MNFLKKISLTLSLAIFLPLQVFALQNQHLVPVDGNSSYYPKVAQFFEEVIAPLYGDQTAALNKIAQAKDRICEVLVEKADSQEQVVGIVVYKNFPVEEFTSYGIASALEIKTLFVVNPEKNSGRGIGSQLINQVFHQAKSNEKFRNVVVTVSEEKPEALGFFQAKGFEIVDSWTGAYKEGITEHLLYKKAD